MFSEILEEIKKYAIDCVRNKEGFIKIGNDTAIVSFSLLENIIKLGFIPCQDCP